MLKFFIRFSSLRPVVIPHHMGRKRMHLELKDTMTRVGGDIKAKVDMLLLNPAHGRLDLLMKQ